MVDGISITKADFEKIKQRVFEITADEFPQLQSALANAFQELDDFSFAEVERLQKDAFFAIIDTFCHAAIRATFEAALFKSQYAMRCLSQSSSEGPSSQPGEAGSAQADGEVLDSSQPGGSQLDRGEQGQSAGDVVAWGSLIGGSRQLESSGRSPLF